MEQFYIGDWIIWDDGANHDAEEMIACARLKEILGAGPFGVEAVFPVAEEDIKDQKHEQYLELNDERGKPVLRENGERCLLSGYWFVKTEIPRRLIN